MFTRKTLLSGLAVFLLLALALSACNVPSPDTPAGDQPAAPAASDGNPGSQAGDNGDGAAPPQATVSMDGVAAFRDADGNWNVIGMVTNRGDAPVDNVVVAVEIYDESENLVLREETGTLTGLIMPGESAPLRWRTTQTLPASFRYSAIIISQQKSDQQRLDLTVRNVNITRADGRVYVTGELVNETGAPVEVYDLATLLFDSNGQPMSANAAAIYTSYLNPNDAGPFVFELPVDPNSDAKMAGSTFYIDARSVAQREPISMKFLPNQYVYRDAQGRLHLVGEVTNTSNRPLDIRLLATMYASDDTVVDASALDLSLRTLFPEQTTSFDFIIWPVLNDGTATPPNIDSFVLQADPGWTLDATTAYSPLDITALDNNAAPDGLVTFEGTLTNNTGSAVEDATIVVVLRNAAGAAVAMGATRTGSAIAAGSTADFGIRFYADPNMDLSQLTYEMEAYGTMP